MFKNKSFYIIIIIIGVLLLFMIFMPRKSGVKYDSWKDTISSFGDGTYQVMHTMDNGRDLYNCKYQQEVLSDVEKYITVDENVYFVGKYDGYNVRCILNVETNFLEYFIDIPIGERIIMVSDEEMIADGQLKILASYDDFTADDKIIFKGLIN